MKLPRASGILLHPTSLPGPHGIGDLGGEAYRFVDFLKSAGQRYWQVLPLTPTGYCNSPYASPSSFAGNTLLISLDTLAEDGLLPRERLEDRPAFEPAKADYDAVATWKKPLLVAAYHSFKDQASPEMRDAFEAFCQDESAWLDDYALFMALREAHDGDTWTEWTPSLATRDAEALVRAREDLAERIAEIQFAQYQFFRQWHALKGYASDAGVSIIGDLPIYVAHDSVDVWAHREMFLVDEDGHPTVVAGVPPDYFSKTGQRWGNPIYNWQYCADKGYQWWMDRMKAILNFVDIVRIDHFRGFESYWAVPAEEETAKNGRWMPGPRSWLFDTLRFVFGDDLPIIAENLGVITPEVEALRESAGLPGMAVFQFGYGDCAATSGFPLHRFTRDLVAYTGTHDNDTILGWWENLGRKKETRPIKQYVKTYLDASGRDFHWTAIRAIMGSVANAAIFPIQDVLGLGNEARMNRPGTPCGNWEWRLTEGALTPGIAERLRALTETYGRLGDE